MDECKDNLEKLKILFSQFAAVVNDFSHDGNPENCDAVQDTVMDACHHQEVQKTPSDRPDDNMHLNVRLTEPILESKIIVIPPVQADQIELPANHFDQYQKVQETATDRPEKLPITESSTIVSPAVEAHNTESNPIEMPVYHFDQSQTVQETQDDSRPDIAPETGDYTFELSWSEVVAAASKTCPILESNIVVIPAVSGNIECSLIEMPPNHFVQYQNVQETETFLLDNIMLELEASPIELSRTGDIIRVNETFPISKSNIVVIPAFQANNIVCGQSESSVILRKEVGPASHMEENSTHQYNLDQENDDYDEDIFKNFVENVDDLDDIEYSSEAQNNFQSIIVTLAERNSHDINSSLPNNEGASQCESTSADPLHHWKLSDKRLIGSIDKTKMFVGTSDQKGKKLCCPYCYKLFCKLSRHVEEKHKDVADVQKLLAIPKGPEFRKQRWIIQNSIKVTGLIKWNTDPSVNTTGELIVPRRPKASLNRKATDFLICPHCISFHSITNLRNHFASCTKGVMKGARNIKILARAIEGRFSEDASEQLREVLPVMRDDEIVQLISFDWLLIAYGNILCMKYGFHFQQNMIRAKLRLAGRVLQALKNINSELTDFASIFYPKRYKSLIEAIKIVGKFDSATNEFGSPATAASALTSVKQIGSILKCEYIQKEDSDHVKRTEDFLYLMESQLSSIINKRVKENQLERKRSKDHKIPSKEDVRLLSAFLKCERSKYLNELSANYSFKTWKKLSEVIIASIIVFNRKRVGESQNTLIKDFERREKIDQTSNEQLYAALSEESKKVAQCYSRMKIRGKKGCLNVNVLLDADITNCINVLLFHRPKAGIPLHNKYLFGLPSPPGEKRINVVNACYVLSKLSTMCGAKDPTTLRGTNLRKHFASECMAKELNDDMTGEVAKFLGHRESVHRENYRHNTIDREIVKIAQLLLAAQGIEQNEDDFSDISSSGSEDEEYVTISETGTSASVKRKKNIRKAQPSKPSVTNSKSAGRKRLRSKQEEHTEVAISKRMKTEVKRDKRKLNAAPSLLKRPEKTITKLKSKRMGPNK